MPFGMLALAPDKVDKDINVIRVIGVGGFGGNAVNRMIKEGFPRVEFLVARTDLQFLQYSKVHSYIQLGPGITKGEGAGAEPKKGTEAALESIEELREALIGSDVIIIILGLGGGTGSGAGPVIARLSKELGAITIGIVTIPFHFEGEIRMKNAKLAWNELRENTDDITIVNNDDILKFQMRNYRLSDMLELAETFVLITVRMILRSCEVKSKLMRFLKESEDTEWPVA